jgi:hypothetical protein
MIVAVEYRLYNSTATSYSLLPAFANVANDTKYNDIGAFQMSYPVYDFVDENGVTFSGANTLGFADGSLVGAVVLYDDGTSTEIERYVIDSTSDDKVKDGVRYRQLTGRSTLGVFLEDALVYPSNWPVTAPAGHQFVDATAGTIWRTLIARAKTRASGTGSTSGIANIVETGFSGTNASDGAAWALTTGDQNLENGTTYLQVAQDHIAHGFIDMRLDGWNLVVQNGGTFGNHVSIGTVEIRPAANVTDMTKATDSTDAASTVLIAGEEGTAVERHSSGAQTIIGRRRERFVSQGGIADSGTLTIIADAELQLVGKINTEETVGVALTALNPWKDFTTSDWVWVRFDTDQAPLERRIRQLALSVDESRNVTVGMTLNSIIEENDVKLQRKIDGYGGSGSSYSSLPTSPDTSIPNAPTLVSGGVTSATFVDASGAYVAAVTATWTPPTTNVGGSTLTDLDGYELFWRYVGDVNFSPALPATDNTFSWSPVAPGRQIEVKVRTVDNSTNRSGFSTTITHTVAVDTSAPPQPSAPVVAAAYASVAVKWDGLGTVSGTPVAMPNDLDRVEIWQSSTSGFTIGAGGSSLAGTLNKAGTYFVQGAFGTQIYIKMRAIDKAGNISASSTQGNAAPSKIQTGQIDPNAVVSDGLPPASSPTPVTVSGLGMFYVKWSAITNHDLVNYEVHVSTTLGFTATLGDSTTVGTTTGTQFAVRQLAGPEPPEGSPDPRALDYNTTYYVRIIAFDVDGAAAQSLQAPATAEQVTGPDIAVKAVTAENIVAGTITGDLFAATVIMSGTFKTAETGQRVETGMFGIKGYKSDGSVMISIPTTSGENMVLDGEFIARSLTVSGAASLQGATEVTTNAVVTLRQGTVSPNATPQLSPTWQSILMTTSTLTTAQKTGPLGTFDLVPTEVQCIEWKDFTTDYWVIHQVRSNGTRSWFFRVSDGAPQPYGAGSTYFTDATDWAYYSVVEITTSTSAKNGVYRMARWIPSGTANTYYLHCPQGTSGFNRYSRQNGVVSPALVTEGNDIGVLEVINTDDLSMKFYTPTGDGSNLGAAFSSYTSTTGFSANVSLCTAPFDSLGFGAGTGRYAVSHRGVNYNVQSLTVSGGNLYPGGSGNNWASANKDAETWESPTSNRRAIAWDAFNLCFWTFGGDGYMYKHTDQQWDPAVTSSTFWGAVTFYDSNATGGTHETAVDLTKAKSYTGFRRAAHLYIPPSVPTGPGTDDPNTTRLYMTRGASAPASTSYHLQTTTVAPTTLLVIGTAGANPPTTNNFPNANPAQIKSADGNLIISGDNTILRNGYNISGAPGNIQTFTSNGTWTKPAEAKWVVAEVWGGGGGGGAAGASATTGASSIGGGGGGGGYSRKLYLASALGATEAVVVGAAGLGQGASGTSGGTSSYNSISATGGGGGVSMTGGVGDAQALGGAGGAGSGGDVNMIGGDGGRGQRLGYNGTSTNTVLRGENYGGMSPYGGGAAMFAGSGAGGGTAGKFPGGGAAGANAVGNTGQVATGINGAGGLVVVTTYF